MPVIATPLPQRLRNTERFELNRSSWQAAGLVGWWPLGAYPDAKDKSLYSNHGTINSVPVAASNAQRRGMLFDGTDDYVNCGTGTQILDSSPLTTMAWFQWVTQQSGYIISCTAPPMSMWYDGSGSVYVGGAAVDNAPYFAWSFDTFWHQLVQIDEGSGTARVYLDGVLQSLTPSGSLNSQTDFLIGGRLDSHKFEGHIDDVRIYQRALGANEVAAIYNQTRDGGYGDLARQPTRFHHLPVAAAVVGEASKSMMLLGVE